MTASYTAYYFRPHFSTASHSTNIYTVFLTIIMPPARGKRGPELDCITRARICELHTTNGWGATTIQKRRFPDIPRSTIQYTLTKEGQRQNQGSLPRPGTPRKLTDHDRDRIYEAIEANPSISIEDLRKEVDFKVCRVSMWRLTHEMGLRKWSKSQRPSSTPVQAEKPTLVPEAA